MAYFSDTQAKEIWKAKWRRETVQSLVARYGENTLRFYEVWEEKRNAGTRLEAFEEFKFESPTLAGAIDPSPHKPTRKVVMRSAANSDESVEQIELFSS